MKPGQIALIVIAILGLGALAFSFLSTASPYVTIAEAKVISGTRLHLAGEIVEDSLNIQPESSLVTFMLKDEDGETILVNYKGTKPNSIDHAERVVAIGSMGDSEFVAEDLLLKCPSRYESELEATEKQA
jgi:cytochrome c-type biogenesis protein CcmE